MAVAAGDVDSVDEIATVTGRRTVQLVKSAGAAA
jgi:hypothetical protein